MHQFPINFARHIRAAQYIAGVLMVCYLGSITQRMVRYIDRVYFQLRRTLTFLWYIALHVVVRYIPDGKCMLYNDYACVNAYSFLQTFTQEH